jgi:hypothetical protein
MELSIFKLAKLKICGYPKADRSGKPTHEFEAMYNPSSLSQQHCIGWAHDNAVNIEVPTQKYTGKLWGELSLVLILDGTGVEEMGIVTLIAPKTVQQRVNEFFATAVWYNGEIHEPNYLQVQWPNALDLPFNCRLSSVTVNYTAFDRDGAPLRAELTVALIRDDPPAAGPPQAPEPESPDLTRSLLVRAGDTLPLLTARAYGSPENYLDVARFNGLDDFRRLTPGQEILFPPLVTFTGASGQG